jgi:pSer/pThr/pTyr-binding forkhead associated (FHA) protein
VLRVGRTRDGNDVSLPGDVNMAGHHCEFFFRDNAWHVRDLDTETGTHVNEEQVSEMVLTNGARVRVGLAEIVYTPDVESRPVADVAESDLADEDDDVLVLRPPTDPTGLPESDGSELKIRTVPPPGTPGRDASILLHGSGKRAKVREIE